MRAMRTLGTLIVVGGTVGLAYGCSAAANAPIGSDPDASSPAASYGGGSDNSGSDASSGGVTGKDAGKGSGGGAYDAGTTVKAPEGSPCNPATALSDPEATESCGLCGTQNRACLSPDGGSSGFAWAAWSPCSGEVTSADKCDPKVTYPATACGNCGTIPQVCDPTKCTFEPGFDCTEPIDACHPTDTKFVLGASCTTAGQGRVYTCSNTCTFGSPSACQAPPPNPNTLTIATSTTGSVNKIFNLAATNLTPRTSGSSCPTTLSSSTPFVDVAIVNPNARAVTVDVWDGPAVSGDTYDTVMAWYPTPAAPPSDRTACTSASDDCSTVSATCSGGSWSTLNTTDGTAVTVPANGIVTVYIGMYHSSDSGNVKLFAKNTN